MQTDSIIFDLDGTLWDSTGSVIDSWNETISKYPEVKNKLTVEQMKNVAGLIIQEAAAQFFPYLSEQTRLQIVGHCCKEECRYLEKHGAVLYSGLEETLKELGKRYRLFIVSNCQDGYIESFFASHGLKGYFEDYESAGRTGLTKGENIKLVIERNHLVSPVYVGDTQGDLKASKHAGIPFIYAKYGFGTVEEYDFAIDHLQGLLCI